MKSLSSFTPVRAHIAQPQAEHVNEECFAVRAFYPPGVLFNCPQRRGVDPGGSLERRGASASCTSESAGTEFDSPAKRNSPAYKPSTSRAELSNGITWPSIVDTQAATSTPGRVRDPSPVNLTALSHSAWPCCRPADRERFSSNRAFSNVNGAPASSNSAACPDMTSNTQSPASNAIRPRGGPSGVTIQRNRAPDARHVVCVKRTVNCDFAPAHSPVGSMDPNRT